MTIIQKIINWAVTTLNSYGLHIMRSYRIPKSNLNLLLLAVPALLYKQGKISFVQIGASDGFTNDPIYPLLSMYGNKLEGVCVEPLPDIFEKLQAHYKNYLNIHLENAVINDQQNNLALYRPIDKTNSDFSQKSSLRKDIVIKHVFSESQIQTIQVKGLSFLKLIEKYHPSKSLDLLLVDTEGSDAEIVKSAFESQCYPKIIYYEHIHLEKQERENIRKLLFDNNYSFTETPKDTLALKAKSI